LITNNSSNIYYYYYYYYYVSTKHRESTASKSTAVASMLVFALLPFVIPYGVVLLPGIVSLLCRIALKCVWKIGYLL
jgi:hypothetical protein